MAPNLRQRLAALSLAPSFPSPPLGVSGPSPLGGRKKSFIPPWKRGSSDVTGGAEPSERDRVQDVMGKVIFQAGVDYETRPMVIVCASALPDPQAVSYDVLLSCILSYLDLYVESDYTVVFFAAGAKHAPSWNWIWKAYRSLSRKYRKNLKRLYIVHSSFFSKMLFSLAGAIISPKFFRKIVYINTLSDLAHYVPFTQIDISPAIYQENLKHEKQINMPVPIRASVFGVPLEELMGFDGEKGSAPRVVKDAIQYIRESGLKEEGLFRRSPNSALLKQVQQAYDRGQVVTLPTFNDPHLAAVLLKKYLRDLPDPLFPETLYPVIRQCPLSSGDPTDIAAIMYIRDTLLPQLKPCVYILLSNVLNLLHEVSLHSASNRMDAHNLAVVVCPNFIKGSSPVKDVMMCAVPGGGRTTSDGNTLFQTSISPQNPLASVISPVSDDSASEGKTSLGAVIVLCIQHYYEVFDEVRDRSEPVPSPSRELARSTSPPPCSPTASTFISKRPLSLSIDDEDSLDDAMLVMPIGPVGSTVSTSTHSVDSFANQASPKGNAFPYQPRQRKTLDAARSLDNDHNGTSSTRYYSTRSRVRSIISIDRPVNGVGSGWGSISTKWGRSHKSTGSGVEALGITAGGFFSPPISMSPPRSPSPGGSGEDH